MQNMALIGQNNSQREEICSLVPLREGKYPSYTLPVAGIILIELYLVGYNIIP
jgi:hypothetical protein